MKAPALGFKAFRNVGSFPLDVKQIGGFLIRHKRLKSGVGIFYVRF